MKINQEQFLHTLQQTLGVEDLTPNADGEYLFEIDGGFDVRLFQTTRDTVVLQSIVGSFEEDRFAAQRYLETVLRYCLLNMKSSGEITTSILPGTRNIVINRAFQPERLTPLELETLLEQFFDTVERWGNLLTEEAAPPPPPRPAVAMIMP